MPVQDRHWTAEMARALPDDGCYEVLDGELFLSPTPSRNHQRAVKEPCSVSTHTFGRMRSANWALLRPTSSSLSGSYCSPDAPATEIDLTDFFEAILR